MENPKIAPVLFCIYNRLSYTQRSFQQIRKAKPPQLFIAADGPKNKKDKINCQEYLFYHKFFLASFLKILYSFSGFLFLKILIN